MANETTIYLAVYGDLHVGSGATPELAREHALANGSEDDGDLQVAPAGATVLDRVLRGEDPGPLELRDGVFERDSLFETRDEEYSSAAEMHLDRLLNAANERDIRSQADLLALALELGIEATDYDEDGAMLYHHFIRFDGTRWVEAKGP